MKIGSFNHGLHQTFLSYLEMNSLLKRTLMVLSIKVITRLAGLNHLVGQDRIGLRPQSEGVMIQVGLVAMMVALVGTRLTTISSVTLLLHYIPVVLHHLKMQLLVALFILRMSSLIINILHIIILTSRLSLLRITIIH